jgi:hypothetical protein
MKTLKITLSLIVLATIATVLIRGCIKEPKSDVIQLPENTSTIIIKQKIDSLKEMPISSFCDKFHIEIKNFIEMDYTDQRFGENTTENDQWKKILSSNLYAAYTDKFISQAFYVFNHAEWEVEKVEFIRKEYQALQKDGYQSGSLEKNSITDQIFNDIKNIFVTYDEITGFINSCKAFSFEEYDNFNNEFPFSTVEQDILRSKEFLESNLENEHVSNCSRLKSSLNDIPQILFDAHVKYLDNKITHLSRKYVDYKNQPDYSKNLYLPLYNEIEKLDNNIYKTNNFDAEYGRLKNKLEQESTTAYNYFQNKG